MLLNLLPGIRQIRTPLTTGYLWLLLIWLWVPSHLKAIPPTTGIPGDVVRLADYSGKIAVGIAISFLAYLIGILSQFFNAPFVAVGTLVNYLLNYQKVSLTELKKIEKSRALRTEFRRSLTRGQFSVDGITRLRDYINRAYPSYKGRVGAVNACDRTDYFRYVIEQTPTQGNALVGKEPDLYGVYDRLISEYEFRTGISVPLAALTATLVAQWTILWLALYIPLLLMLNTGSQQRMAAGDLLADALRLGRLELPDPLPRSQPSADPALASAGSDQPPNTAHNMAL